MINPDPPKPESLHINNPAIEFEYVKLAQELDECEDIEMLRAVGKAYCRLYLKQKELYNDMVSEGQIHFGFGASS